MKGNNNLISCWFIITNWWVAQTLCLLPRTIKIMAVTVRDSGRWTPVGNERRFGGDHIIRRSQDESDHIPCQLEWGFLQTHICHILCWSQSLSMIRGCLLTVCLFFPISTKNYWNTIESSSMLHKLTLNLSPKPSHLQIKLIILTSDGGGVGGWGSRCTYWPHTGRQILYIPARQMLPIPSAC